MTLTHQPLMLHRDADSASDSATSRPFLPAKAGRSASKPPRDPKRKGTRFISLQLSMAAAFAITVLVTAAFIGTTTFFAARTFIRDSIRYRLQDIATLAAKHLDVATIAQLTTAADRTKPEYLRLKEALREVKSTNSDIRFAYLYRVQPDGRVTFVADNEPLDSKDISHLGDEYKEASEVARAAYHSEGAPVSERDFIKDQWGVYLSAYIPIRTGDGRVECALGIDMSAKAVQDYEARFFKTLVALGAFTAVVVLIASLWYARRISRPLRALAEDLGRVERLELGHQTNIDSYVLEVVMMRDAVAKMKSSLRSFRKYVPADLVSDLMKLGQEARLSAEKREVTVFFSDIADFTTISEKTPPERLVENLSVYFDGMTRSIIEQKGTVDKYIGDAIMAFWGAPHSLEDHAVQACLAAIRCRDHSLAVAEQQKKEGKLPMLTRIGLNTGVAIIGNIGYDERLNYTAMGDMVNLGSRLEGLNKFYGTLILMSETTRELTRHAIASRFIDVVAVKGKTIPVRIYEVLCERSKLAPETRHFVMEYERGMDLYLNRQFAPAAEVFSQLSARYPEDLASANMTDRCRKFIDQPPAPEWQGEFVMKSK